MEGKTFIYKATDGEEFSQVAFFDNKMARYSAKNIKDKDFALTITWDALGRIENSFYFYDGKKWAMDFEPDHEMIEVAGYRMYAASWMDTTIMGYECQAYFIRDKTLFAPTYVFWVCDDSGLPKKHPKNLRYPTLPGYIMAYSWNSKRRFELSEIVDTVDPYLFSDLDVEEETKDRKAMKKVFKSLIRPLLGNSVGKAILNLHRLFAG